MDSTTKTLLVVDDDSICHEAVRRHLGAVFNLRNAESLRVAREIVDSVEVHCVLLDFRLPDGEGISLLPFLAERRIPAIVCTSQGNEEIAVRAMQQGADDYIVKNALTRATLSRSVENALEKARLRAELNLREQEKDELIARLQQALNDIETLRGLISICSRCKKIKDDDGAWKPVEHYVSLRSQARFSHGFCPECYERELEALNKPK